MLHISRSAGARASGYSERLRVLCMTERLRTQRSPGIEGGWVQTGSVTSTPGEHVVTAASRQQTDEGRTPNGSEEAGMFTSRFQAQDSVAELTITQVGTPFPPLAPGEGLGLTAVAGCEATSSFRRCSPEAGGLIRSRAP